MAGEHVLPVPPLELPAPDAAEPLAQLRQNEAVLLFIERAAAASGTLRADRRQPGGGRRPVPPARRAAAGDRAGGGPDPGAEPRADPRPPRRPVRPAHRRQPGRAAAPPDAAHHDRVELRPADGGRADAAAAAVRVRGPVHAGRRRGGVRSADVPPARALDLLSSLVDKSLVIKEDAGGAACYRLHETMREYARLKLREAGEARRRRTALRRLLPVALRAVRGGGPVPAARLARLGRPGDRQHPGRPAALPSTAGTPPRHRSRHLA